MDKEVANPFKILSAYLITAATTRPPSACKSFKRLFFTTHEALGFLYKLNLIMVSDLRQASLISTRFAGLVQQSTLISKGI